ncbi:alpha/beta fold hydrolase [Nonomuraea sp. NPDC050556]|uniref:alpha/beta fold hydrolase n=1 Tax=Nonomuraea sp. NPDC050556 TaxID=3364369 RepID=UPI0037AEDFDF
MSNAQVTSADGTTIGYLTLGHGPGLVISHGGMGSSHNHLEQARALADAFTVHLPDRRGHGMSGPWREDDHLLQDVQDLDAVLAATGATNLFGLSTGGLIALQAALTLPAVRKLAVYEPGLSTAPTGWVPRFERELAQGRTSAALTTAMLGAQMGPSFFSYVPRRLLELLTDRVMRKEDRDGAGGYIPLRDLAPTLRHDARLLIETHDLLDDFRGLRTEVLLLGGSKSPAFQRAALDALERVLPRSRRTELAGLGHAGPWNADKGGDPERVAAELRGFFT